MPRTENQSNYHYVARIRDKNSNEDFYNKYFLTMKDASQFFGCAKSTCYDRLYNGHYWSNGKKTHDCSTRWKYLKNYELDLFEKLDPPLPRFQKIMVHFD